MRSLYLGKQSTGCRNTNTLAIRGHWEACGQNMAEKHSQKSRVGKVSGSKLNNKLV